MENIKSKPEEWVNLYGNLLYRFALMRVRDAGVAEDLVQETFLAALKSHGNFKGESTEKSWMVGILKHKILDHYRKMARNEELQLSGDESLDKPNIDFEAVDTVGKEWALEPSEQLDREEFRTVLQKCLKKIPPKMARVFTMRELDHMPTEEICKELNISPTNVWVILHRARLGLQNCLELKWFKENLQRGHKEDALVRSI